MFIDELEDVQGVRGTDVVIRWPPLSKSRSLKQTVLGVDVTIKSFLPVKN